MPHRKKKQSKTLANQQTPVSPIFDTALPVALREAAQAHTRKQAPRLNTGKNIALSPYVIRLSHENAPVAVAAEPQKSEEEVEIQALMDQLMNMDADHEKSEESEVLVDFVDLMNQVREDLGDSTVDLRTPMRHKKKDNYDSLLVPLAESTEPAPDFTISLTETVIDEPVTSENVIESESIATAELVQPETIAVLEDTTEAEIARPARNFRATLTTLSGNFRYRMTASFVALSLLFVLPIHAMQEFGTLPAMGQDIVASGHAAASQFKEGGEALMASDFGIAADRFEYAADAFGEIQQTISRATRGIGLVASVIPQSARALRTTDALVATGESLSQVARLFSLAIADINAQTTLSPTDKIALFSTYLEKTQPHIALANESVKQIDTRIIPEAQQELVNTLLDTVPPLLDNVAHLREYLNATYTILGGEEQKSYLLVFQNTAELRATGGFMGSFAEIKIDQGRVRGIHVPKGGTYDIQGQLQSFVAPPEPLRLINARWEFQDANWFPDFRLSAKKMLEFHGAAGGPTMDGVIAINSSVLPRILTVTGPLLVDGKELNSENVLFELQQRETTTVDAPKALVSSLTEALFAHLEETDAATMLALSDVLFSSLPEQEMQLYMRDRELAEAIGGLGWNGAQLPYSFDALQVIDTNIGGGKSDAVIDQHIDLQVHIEEDGSVINTVTVTRTHRGIASAIFEGTNNVNYMRVYVPRGSTLLGAEGFYERPPDHLFKTSDIALSLDRDLELATQQYQQDSASLTDIWEENGFTVFGNWIQTKPGETETVVIQYKLPHSIIANDFSPTLLKEARSRLGFKNVTSYSLVLQKQSGVDRRKTTVSVAYPPSWKKAWDSFTDEALNNQSTRIIQALFERP